ncbi:DUF742 domain-containing protein [Dactylosporangium sp. AC04546]|uniref:DUF742 domain-containing protein n=1 Tax=Dactylosporangium sp. AC04546 TaxID=2862460 RepID=UPI001EDFA6C7|nr:DUF742 domain-containing protein [Dactylosporangium sp. AC04546]WVK87890.1 DUF742 domain-containing protein [Dactylosporangium sp. AC04546]
MASDVGDDLGDDLAGEIWLDEEAGPLVRLYALTRGRVAAQTDGLDVAALVTTSAASAGAAEVSPEQREILRHCVRPVSVAEVAAHLGVPLGTARVLLADLRTAGLVVAGPDRGVEAPSEQLLGKVLNALLDL